MFSPPPLSTTSFRLSLSLVRTVLVLNSPHNPTGHVATRAELELVADVCQQHDLLAISDEVYEACVFPSAAGATHLRLTDMKGMANRTVTLGSGGKARALATKLSSNAPSPRRSHAPSLPRTHQLRLLSPLRTSSSSPLTCAQLFALTGWRVAWAYGPSELIGPIGRSHTHLTFSAPTPLQVGVAAALRCDDGLDAVGPLFGENFDALASVLKEHVPSVRDVCAAEGGYFLVAQTDGSADVEFCKALAATKGVVCTPMSVFYSTPFDADEPCTLVRFTVCKSREYVQNACAALRSTDVMGP